MSLRPRAVSMPPTLASQARRHSLLLGLSSCITLGGAWPRAQAGPHIEEPLADAVRSVLSAAIARPAPPRPEFASEAARLAHERWLTALDSRLTRHFPQPQIRREFLQTVWYEAQRSGLKRELVLGLIQVESGFRKFAVSSAGARGYMQVMPFWSRLIGDGDASKLFDLQTNLRFGCVILRHYLDLERGELFLALGRYNGSRGKAPYPEAVLAASRQWTP